MKFKASTPKQVSAMKLREGVTLLMLIQIKRVCGSCEATGNLFTGRNCRQVRSSSFWTGYVSGSSLQSDLYKKNKYKNCGLGLSVWMLCSLSSWLTSDVFIPAHSRSPVWQQGGSQSVHVEMENRRGDAGSIFSLRFLSCIAFSSSACFYAFLYRSITNFFPLS